MNILKKCLDNVNLMLGYYSDIITVFFV